MISASGTTFTTANGHVCCIGDQHNCPIHGVTNIVSGGSSNSKVHGKAIAINGSVAGCGAVLNGNFAPRCSTV